MASKRDLQKQIKALEVLNNEVPIKYPAGSTITFISDNIDHNFPKDVPLTYSCSFYDKVGRSHPSNRIQCPHEWQHLPEEETNKIAAMFDKPIIIRIVRI